MGAVAVDGLEPGRTRLGVGLEGDGGLGGPWVVVGFGRQGGAASPGDDEPDPDDDGEQQQAATHDTPFWYPA